MEHACMLWYEFNLPSNCLPGVPSCMIFFNTAQQRALRCAVFHFRQKSKKPCSVCHERASRESESTGLKLAVPLSFRVCCSYDCDKGKHWWCHHPPVDVLTCHITEIWHVSAPFQWQGLSDSSVWWYQWEGGQKKLSGLRMDYIPQHIRCIQRPYRHPSLQSDRIILIWGGCICGGLRAELYLSVNTTWTNNACL